MREATSHTTDCAICKQVAVQRSRVEPAERIPGKGFPQAMEMADHARCEKCGILMGPGHIEAASNSLCGTCQCRVSTADRSSPPERKRSTIGRRGWLSDYPAER